MLLLGLGTNLGDRLQNLRDAVNAIHQLDGVSVSVTASLYETDPVDCPPDSEPFYNTVIGVTTTRSAEELLPLFRATEANLGRPNVHGHHTPRTIDIDLLANGDITINTPTLTLPHPRMLQRRFVLQPLADIAGSLILPGQMLTIAEHLAALQSPEPPLKLVAKNWLPPPLIKKPTTC